MIANALLIHADWSVSAAKRWAAWAEQARDGSWRVNQVALVGDTSSFLKRLSSAADSHSVLAGFDFPIGLPIHYARELSDADFPSFLSELTNERLQTFTSVATVPDEISLDRPFYPASSRKGVSQASLLQALGAKQLGDLRRSCEHATDDRRAACPLFWTLGGNQVGRAALSGWAEVIGPAVRSGANLWPFDDALNELMAVSGLTLAETYPAEAYGHVGIGFRANESKRRQSDRRRKVDAIRTWAERSKVSFTLEVTALIEDGFGADKAGEDRFDALAGLFGMIEVVSGLRTDDRPRDPDILRWEGWILGQAQPELA